MVLIKCDECGKEISSRASSCPNCGCPVETINEEIKKEEKKITKKKDDEEKEIISIKLDIERMQKIRKICTIIGIICCCTIYLAVVAVFLALFVYILIISEKNELTLTNKRIKGSIKYFLNTQTINIPIERIDNIIVNQGMFGSSISIMSNNLRKNVNFVLNAQEFCDTAVKEIEKYKNNKEK